MREKLTDKFARGAKPGIYWDHDRRAVPGFMLRVTTNGARSYCLNYRVKDTGRERRYTIGDIRSWPIGKAREEAHRLRRLVDQGRDPLGEREDARGEPTVADLAERFIVEALASRAEGTAGNYRAMLRDWILPVLGRRKVSAVDREDIERLHRRVTEAGHARQANAVKSLLSVLFRQAIVWRMRETNPCVGVAGNREHGRERYLTPDEIERLTDVLDAWRERRPDSVDTIRLLLLTGARRGEVVAMRWADLDLDAAVWAKPASSTKQRRPHRAPLSAEAVAVLRRRQSERDTSIVRLRGDDCVFRGAGSKSHTNELQRDWHALRAVAGIEDVRLHDLRHSFASLLVSQGLSLPIIGALLGHSKPTTTARYAHLADRPLREAAAVVGRIVGRRPS